MAGRIQRGFMNFGPGTIGILFGLYWDNGKENRDYRGLIKGFLGALSESLYVFGSIGFGGSGFQLSP